MYTRTAWCVAAAAVCAAVSHAVPAQIHVFTDMNVVDSSSTGMYIQLQTPEKDATPLLQPEYPWEVGLHFYTSLLTLPPALSLTGNLTYILYYACTDGIAFFTNMSVCVANSSDGVAWTKPLLPYFPYGPSQQATNIVWVTNANEFVGSVFLDAAPNVPPSQAIKMAYENDPARYVSIAVSPDGYRFSAYENEGAALPFAGFADTQVAMIFDAATSSYWAYGRRDADVNNNTLQCAGGYASERHVLMSSAPAMPPAGFPAPVNWSEPVEVVQLGLPDPADCFDNYNPGLIRYQDAFLLLSSEFWHFAEAYSRAPTPRAAGNDGIMDIRLLTSRDGSNFTFVSRDAFITRGVGYRDDVSGWYNVSGSDLDAGFVFATVNGLIAGTAPPGSQQPAASMHVLYWGSQTTHAGGGAYLFQSWPGAFSGIFRAKLRTEGFAALSTPPAGADGTGAGWFVTVPLTIPSPAAICSAAALGTQLAINVKTSVAGSASVTVLNTDGSPVAGWDASSFQTLKGNYIRTPLAWNVSDSVTSDLWAAFGAAGVSVRFNFSMTRTLLYAWEWQCVGT